MALASRNNWLENIRLARAMGEEMRGIPAFGGGPIVPPAHAPNPAANTVQDWCCIIDSSLLGEKIVVVSLEPHIERARMMFPKNVIYTHDEIAKLDNMAPESVKGIHDVKKAFNGAFLQLINPAAAS